MLRINVMTRALRHSLYTRRAKDRNPEPYRLRKKRWRQAHPEAACKRTRAWQIANPDKLRSQRHLRRARLRGSGGSWSAEQWVALKLRYGNRCLCCQRTEDELHFLNLMLVPDHVIPLVNGGSNDLSNIQPLCHGRKRGSRGGCNNAKRDSSTDYRGKYEGVVLGSH